VKPFVQLRDALFDARATQWIAAALLSAALATAVLTLVTVGFGARLSERSGFQLGHLQMAGVVRWWNPEASPTEILAAWKRQEILDVAQRAQWWDWWYPIAYGALGALLMVALARAYPPGNPRHIWAQVPSFLVIAALLDELENVFLALMLWTGSSSQALALPASALATLKWACVVFFLLGVATALARVSRTPAAPMPTPGDLDGPPVAPVETSSV
jgi:hypothetical protein